MQALLDLLKGKKTYLTMAAAAGVFLAAQLNYIDVESANTALTLLGFGGIVTLRAAIAAQQTETAAAATETRKLVASLTRPGSPYEPFA